MPKKINFARFENTPRLEAKIFTPLYLTTAALSNLLQRGSETVYRNARPDLGDHILNSSAHPILGYTAGYLANKLFARHSRLAEVTGGIAGTILIDLGIETGQSYHDRPGAFIDYLATHATRMETLRDFSAAAVGWVACAAIYWKHTEAGVTPAGVEPAPELPPPPYDWTQELAQ